MEIHLIDKVYVQCEFLRDLTLKPLDSSAKCEDVLRVNKSKSTVKPVLRGHPREGQ